MNYEYGDKIIELIKETEEKDKEVIETLIEKFVECIENDKVIHTFGTGHSHMLGIELFARAGGLGNVDAMIDPDTVTGFGAQRSCAMEKVSGVADVVYDSYNIQPGDIILITSNSGRNAMPIEMAMRARKEGVYTVALTNVAQSSSQTSRHSSGKRLFECADLVIDTNVPTADACLDIDGILTGPCSSIVTMFLVNTVASEAIRRVVAHGKRPYVFQSQNVDGFSNDDIYEHFKGRIKHF
ncbi:MAG: sugar isomerase domain-containing protein [Erysipelotrichaceae bacterium]|nr:sugar isomerase domain-containing protein [Erysipelotrichaceae bacterium]